MRQKKKRKTSERLQPLLVTAGCLILRMLCRTLRFRVEYDDGFLAKENTMPSVLVMWHNRILTMPYFRARFARHIRLSVLTSASRDGDILARVVNHFGLGAVRGSSSQRGAKAVRELHTCIHNGEVIVVTPDGPRGPRYRMKSGVIQIARQTNVPIFISGVRYSRYLELKSWDRFRIPYPFSSVTLTIRRIQNTGIYNTAVDPETAAVWLEAEMNRLNEVENDIL